MPHTPIDECLHFPTAGCECWIYHEGRPLHCKVIRRTKCFYQVANVETFINHRGEQIHPGECVSLPPGFRNATFRVFVEGRPAPPFHPVTGRPLDSPPLMTPLF